MNAKVNFNFGKHDNLMLSVFNDQDVLGIKNLTNMKWGSTVVNSRWSHRFNDDLDLNSNLLQPLHYRKLDGCDGG